MTAFLLTLNVLICVALVILILLQRNDPSAGGMFGGTGGAGGPAIRNPLAAPTAYLAAAFMIISLVIAYTHRGGGHADSVVGEETVPVNQPMSNTTDALPAAAMPVSGTGMPMEASASATAPLPAPSLAPAPTSPSEVK